MFFNLIRREYRLIPAEPTSFRGTFVSNKGLKNYFYSFESSMYLNFMFKRIIILFILFHSAVSFTLAQVESSVGSIADHNIESWYEIKIDSQILQSLSQSKQSKDVAYQFAIPVPVNLNSGNSGCLYRDGDETIWVLGIRSKNAKSLGLILEPFKLPAGAYVYIYDRSKKIIRGAFTDENNYQSAILPTMPVPGEELILEYHVPANAKLEKTLGVSQVSHDYLGILGEDDIKDNRYKLSQACNQDINCTEGNQMAIEKRSVCRLLVGGTELCTGFLVNNTNQENRALLITAQHCIANQNDADKSIFVFGYESPWCNGPDGRVYHSLSGSVLRSTNADVDFSIVELNTFPPYVYKPYLAGWDISGAIPVQTSAIHHPLGDVKKISVDLDQPVSATFSSMPANSAWKIVQWDIGTTEGGSSGSPIFDQNKRVVGILTGGEAVCGRSVNDYFVKLSVCYNYSQLLWQQVKGWIDPAVTGLKQFNGRDPYASNSLTCDTLSNIGKTELRSVTKYSLPKQGYSTGFNSDSLVMYAEHFTNSRAIEISEIWLNISKASYVKTTDSVRVFVYGDGLVPGAVLASQKAFISEAKDTFVLKYDFSKTVSVTGNFYIGWRIWYANSAFSETRQFAVFHSPDRVQFDKNTAWFNNGSGWKTFVQHPFEPMPVSLDVKVITVTNSKVNHIIDNKTYVQKFTIYPIPADTKIIISSERLFDDINLRIFDITGDAVFSKKISGNFPGEIPIDISSVKPGFYLVNIFSRGYSETHKILISR
jgi:lysyl endopeptidase